jgi:hypothetical protein
LTSQIAITKKGRGGRRTLPYAFIEHDEVQLLGNKSVIFDAIMLGSGIFFCRLQEGSFTQTKKLLFLK